MEIRIRSFFRVTLLGLVVLTPAGLWAQSESEDSTTLIEPEVERVEFDESLIDALDFEMAIYAGMLAVENFDTNPVIGLKIGYHISEDFFVQASYGTSEVGETSFEKLTGGAPLLSDDEREIEYYLFSLGYNLFPGETFFTDSTTFNTVLYLSGGIGSTDFAGDDRHTIAFAVGHRTLFADGFSLDIEMRDLIFDVDIFGSQETTHNLEFTFSLNLFL
jgi:outer membrane beta-barrel protein